MLCRPLFVLFVCCVVVDWINYSIRTSLLLSHSNSIRTLGQYNEEKHKETTWFQFYLAALVALCFAHAWMTWSFGQWQLPVEKELSESIDKIVNTWFKYHLLCSFITICFWYAVVFDAYLNTSIWLVELEIVTTRYIYKSYLVDPASSHMLVSKIKPCMSKYKHLYTVKLRTAHYISNSFFDGFLLHG